MWKHINHSVLYKSDFGFVGGGGVCQECDAIGNSCIYYVDRNVIRG
jgi:hypothetical protein